MRYRTAFAPVLLTIISACFCPNSRAQLPPHLERCLAWPPPDADSLDSDPTIAFDRISFHDPQPSQHVQRLLIRATRNHTFRLYPHWTDELAEAGMRGILQEHGYFRAEVSAKAEILSRDAQHDHVSLTIRVDPGARYWLGSLQFRSADPNERLAFSKEQLRAVVPLRDGDVFDVSELRDGFDALKRLYGSRGWIDFTPTPDFQIDDPQRRLDLTIVIDQERQYRIGQTSFLGENPVAEKIARSTFKTGELLNVSLLKQFFAEHESILPAGASDRDIVFSKNVKTGVANTQFDFRTCPAFWE